MSDNKTNEFKINGVPYKCRTCFDPGRQVYLLTDKYSDSKTWRHLLNDVAQLKINDNEGLPNTICCKCLKKVVSFYYFLLQVENVSKKYFELISNCKNTSKDAAPTNADTFTECLAESKCVLPLEQFVSEIKFEDERIVPYDIVFEDASISQFSRNEDVNNAFKENIEGEELPIQQRSLKVEINDPDGTSSSSEENNSLHEKTKKKSDGNEKAKSSSSSEENDCLPEKLKKKGDANKNTNSSQYAQNENKNVGKSYAKRTFCNRCKTSFSSSWYLRQHVKTVHTSSQKNENKDVSTSYAKRTKCNKCKTSYSSPWYLRQHVRAVHRRYTSSSEDEDMLPISESFDKKTIKKHPDLFKITQVGNHFICPVCKKSFTLQRNCRRHVLAIHCSQKDMFPCGFCDHIASCKQYLKLHITRMHPGKSYKLNVKQIIYRFGDRIYSKPSPWRLVECKLCYTNFVTTKQLRQHLQKHSDPLTLDSLELDSSIVQRWFPGMDLISIKATITKNILEKDWFRYYNVLNEFLFELSISDTEEEDLEDDDLAERQRKYNCELCAKDFPFKYQIYAHLKEEHSKNEIPFKCSRCKLEFVSLNMYEQHKQIHCRNEYKNFKCSYCPGKFVSEHNMKTHYCVRETPDADSDTLYPSEKSVNENLLENKKPDNLDSDQEHIEFLEYFKNQKLCETLNDAGSSTPSDTQQNQCIESSINCKNPEQFNESQTLCNTSKTSPDTMDNTRYCYLCPQTFYNIDQLNDHLAGHRLETSAMKTVESIVHSTLWPNGEKIIKCKICSLQFTSMVELKDHFSPNNLSSKCTGQHSLANYSITNQKGFELHLELDSETESESDTQPKHDKRSADLEPYKCQMCNTTFKRKYQIAQHQRSRHNYELLKLRCECCLFRTVSQKLLDHHRATQCSNVEKKHHCHQCNFRFMWKENLANHIWIFHSPTYSSRATSKIADPNLQSTLHNNERPYKCNICDAAFIQSDQFQRHLLGHSCVKPHKCDICGKGFVAKVNLKNHVRHVHNDDPYFQCKQCKKSFGSQYILDYHMLTHTGEYPFECNICKKKFGKPSLLRTHKLNHTGEKPFRCGVCEQRFKCRDYLKKHMQRRGHHNENN